MTETSRNCLLLDSGLGEFPPRPGVSVEPLDSLWSGNQDLIRGLLPTIWRSMQPSNLTPPLMLENFLHRLFQALSFCHMFSVWNLNGTPLLPVLIHVDVKYSWGLLGWKHMHKATGGVLGVIMHRSVSLPVHPCTNEQTGVLLLSCCPILAPSTSPACLLASPSSSQGCTGRWILMELHYLGNFCEMHFCFMLLLLLKALEKIPNHPRVDGNNTFIFHLFVPSASQSLSPTDLAGVLKTYLIRR